MAVLNKPKPAARFAGAPPAAMLPIAPDASHGSKETAPTPLSDSLSANGTHHLPERAAVPGGILQGGANTRPATMPHMASDASYGSQEPAPAGLDEPMVMDSPPAAADHAADRQTPTLPSAAAPVQSEYTASPTDSPQCLTFLTHVMDAVKCVYAGIVTSISVCVMPDGSFHCRSDVMSSGASQPPSYAAAGDLRERLGKRGSATPFTASGTSTSHDWASVTRAHRPHISRPSHPDQARPSTAPGMPSSTPASALTPLMFKRETVERDTWTWLTT